MPTQKNNKTAAIIGAITVLVMAWLADVLRESCLIIISLCLVYQIINEFTHFPLPQKNRKR